MAEPIKVGDRVRRGDRLGTVTHDHSPRLPLIEVAWDDQPDPTVLGEVIRADSVEVVL